MRSSRNAEVSGYFHSHSHSRLCRLLRLQGALQRSLQASLAFAAFTQSLSSHFESGHVRERCIARSSPSSTGKTRVASVSVLSASQRCERCIAPFGLAFSRGQTVVVKGYRAPLPPEGEEGCTPLSSSPQFWGEVQPPLATPSLPSPLPLTRLGLRFRGGLSPPNLGGVPLPSIRSEMRLRLAFPVAPQGELHPLLPVAIRRTDFLTPRSSRSFPSASFHSASPRGAGETPPLAYLPSLPFGLLQPSRASSSKTRRALLGSYASSRSVSRPISSPSLEALGRRQPHRQTTPITPKLKTRLRYHLVSSATRGTTFRASHRPRAAKNFLRVRTARLRRVASHSLRRVVKH